jgi:hypothetical protein
MVGPRPGVLWERLGTVQELAVLTEYEAGHAITAIEWVARSGKPIMEVGSRLVTPREVHRLAADRCLDIAGESDVRAFIARGSDSWWQFGFYRHPWAIAAFLHLQSGTPRVEGAHAIWVRGLLFGYDAEAIEGFISSVSRARASMSRPSPYRRLPSSRRVGIYDSVALSARSRSNLSGRCRPSG